MKKKLLILFIFVYPVFLQAQDTIFVKNGQVIPALIVEKNDIEIKYKKFDQPESTAIYSLFVSDIRSIHYSNGIIADYTQAGQEEKDNKPAAPIENAGTMRAIKFSIGGLAESFNRNPEDKLLVFWKNRSGDPNATIDGNPLSFPFHFKFQMPLDRMQRNWLGDELRFNITPADAIYAVNADGSSEISLKNFYTSIIIFYGRSLNHKNNLLAILEPGLDMAFMSGNITLNNTSYKLSANTGMGFHIALGADWLISKRFTASLRGGYRSMTIKEMHESSSSSTGYANFYVDPSVSEELLKIKWDGSYVSFGLQWSFYTKMKSAITNE